MSVTPLQKGDIVRTSIEWEVLDVSVPSGANVKCRARNDEYGTVVMAWFPSKDIQLVKRKPIHEWVEGDIAWYDAGDGFDTSCLRFYRDGRWRNKQGTDVLPAWPEEGAQEIVRTLYKPIVKSGKLVGP